MEENLKHIKLDENYFSNELKKVFTETEEYCISKCQKEIEIKDFFIVTLSNKDCFLYKLLNTYFSSLTIENIRQEIETLNKTTLISSIPVSNLNVSGKLQGMIYDGYQISKSMSCKMMTSDHVFLAVLFGYEKKGLNAEIAEIFQKKGATYSISIEKAKELHGIIEKFKPLPTNTKNMVLPPPLQDMGNMFGLNNKDVKCYTNLNVKAEHKEIDELIGRNNEILEIAKVLGRRKNSNVILVGKEGVGKTCLIEGVAKMIVENTAPITLKDKVILRLETAELISGTQLRGAFETKFNELIKIFSKNPNYILFIDNIDNIFNNGSKDEYNFTGMLKDALSNTNLKIIGTTNYKGYKSIFNKDKDLASKFQKVVIEEPSEEECYEIVKKTINLYEDFHTVIYSDNAIRESIKLAKRYISDKALPSSVFDIIDEAGSICKMNYTDSIEINESKKELVCLETKKSDLIAEFSDDDKLEDINKKIDELKLKISKLIDAKYGTANTINESDIRNLISKKIGIPQSHVDNGDIKQLLDINNTLKKVVIGQDDAIDTISNAIKRNRVGLNPKNKPIFSCFCVGPTGCGKSLLAKTIAKEIYGDEKYLVRFDMSEYSDKSSVTKLIGSSTGYIDSDKGGLLTEAIKNRKYSVLLLDEIEKSNTEVFNLFLQVLDEGYLVDNSGDKVDFKNTIILMTSNVGAERSTWDKGIGFNKSENDKSKEVIKKEMKKKFPPEFINRIDDIVYFNKLTEDNLKNIINIQLAQLSEQLSANGHMLIINPNVNDYIFDNIQSEKEYGARPIARCIQNNIENPITDKILENFDKGKLKFEISNIDNEIVINVL